MIAVPSTGKIFVSTGGPTRTPLPIDVISRPTTIGNAQA